ncbi:MAG: flagellar motor switch protein FliG [Planctomycetota bacterium]
MGNSLNGSQKVAALLLGIDPTMAANVMRHMGEDHVDLVTQAMKEIEDMAVGEQDLCDVYKEAVIRMRGAGLAFGDVSGLIKTVLMKAFGNNRGEEILESVEHRTLAQRPFAVFEQIPAEELASLLGDEHPQIISVFLAHLDAKQSGQVINHLPEKLKADVLLRIAGLGRSSPEVVQRVVQVMRKKVKDLGLSTARAEPGAWVKKAASIMNNLAGSAERNILDEIAEVDSDIAELIRDEMFTFDDLSQLDKKSMQKVLGSVDTAVLALALKACSKEAEENIFNNLSKRAGEMVIDERDAKGPMPLSDVLDAQKQVLAAVRNLIETGEINAPGAPGEEMV